MGIKSEQWDKAAYDLDEAKENWLNVSGTLNYMDLGIKAKKPDWKKLQAAMTKTRKPAKYFMTMDGLKFTFEVRVATTKFVLNRLDISKVRGVAKQREILRRLEDRTKIVTKADLVRFDKATSDPEDSKAVVGVNEELDKLRGEIDWLKQTAKAGNYRNKTIDKGLYMNKEFRSWAKKKGYGGFTDFLIDVDAKAGWTNRVSAFLDLGRRTGLRPETLAELLEARDSGARADFSEARKQVAEVVNRAMLPKYNQEGLRRIAQEIKKREAKAKELERKLRSLRAA